MSESTIHFSEESTRLSLDFEEAEVEEIELESSLDVSVRSEPPEPVTRFMKALHCSTTGLDEVADTPQPVALRTPVMEDGAKRSFKSKECAATTLKGSVKDVGEGDSPPPAHNSSSSKPRAIRKLWKTLRNKIKKSMGKGTPGGMEGSESASYVMANETESESSSVPMRREERPEATSDVNDVREQGKMDEVEEVVLESDESLKLEDMSFSDGNRDETVLSNREERFIPVQKEDDCYPVLSVTPQQEEASIHKESAGEAEVDASLAATQKTPLSVAPASSVEEGGPLNPLPDAKERSGSQPEPLSPSDGPTKSKSCKEDAVGNAAAIVVAASIKHVDTHTQATQTAAKHRRPTAKQSNPNRPSHTSFTQSEERHLKLLESREAQLTRDVCSLSSKLRRAQRMEWVEEQVSRRLISESNREKKKRMAESQRQPSTRNELHDPCSDIPAWPAGKHATKRAEATSRAGRVTALITRVRAARSLGELIRLMDPTDADGDDCQEWKAKSVKAMVAEQQRRSFYSSQQCWGRKKSSPHYSCYACAERALDDSRQRLTPGSAAGHPFPSSHSPPPGYSFHSSSLSIDEEESRPSLRRGLTSPLHEEAQLHSGAQLQGATAAFSGSSRGAGQSTLMTFESDSSVSILSVDRREERGAAGEDSCISYHSGSGASLLFETMNGPGVPEMVASGSLQGGQSATTGSLHEDQSAATGSLHEDQSATTGSLHEDQSAASGSLHEDQSAATGSLDEDQSAASGSLRGSIQAADVPNSRPATGQEGVAFSDAILDSEAAVPAHTAARTVRTVSEEQQEMIDRVSYLEARLLSQLPTYFQPGVDEDGLPTTVLRCYTGAEEDLHALGDRLEKDSSNDTAKDGLGVPPSEGEEEEAGHHRHHRRSTTRELLRTVISLRAERDMLRDQVDIFRVRV